MKAENFIGKYFLFKPECYGKLFLVLTLFISPLQWISASPHSLAHSFKSEKGNLNRNQINVDEILKFSRISYQADGGFTGIRAYGIQINCVEGKITSLCSIVDPRVTGSSKMPVYKKGTMDIETYLTLWKNLNRMAVFKKKDAALPKLETTDEFTFNFSVQVGKSNHHFSVEACSRPEASQYYAIKSILDKAVQMTTLWGFHKSMAGQLPSLR